MGSIPGLQCNQGDTLYMYVEEYKEMDGVSLPEGRGKSQHCFKIKD